MLCINTAMQWCLVSNYPMRKTTWPVRLLFCRCFGTKNYDCVSVMMVEVQCCYSILLDPRERGMLVLLRKFWLVSAGRNTTSRQEWLTTPPFVHLMVIVLTLDRNVRLSLFSFSVGLLSLCSSYF